MLDRWVINNQSFDDIVCIFNIFLSKAVENTMAFYQVKMVYLWFILIHLILFLKESSIFIKSID